MADELISSPTQPPADNAAWKEIVREFQKPSRARAWWQIINTLVPYAAIWYLIYLSRSISWWLVLPLVVLLVKQRFPTPNASKRERHSVYWMDFAILGMVAGLSFVFGVLPYIFIQLAMLAVAGSAGFWLFYVQHQFEGVYWERAEQWDYAAAALEGSSFYKLSKGIQWF